MEIHRVYCRNLDIYIIYHIINISTLMKSIFKKIKYENQMIKLARNL